MDSTVINYIQAKRIDSIQKLQFLLFLHQHPEMRGNSTDFALRSYIGSVSQVEKIINDLQSVGLLEQIGGYYQLCNAPHVKLALRKLAVAFEDPLERQQLIDYVKQVDSRRTNYTPYH